MFAAAYFAPREYAPSYFPKVGAIPAVVLPKGDGGEYRRTKIVKVPENSGKRKRAEREQFRQELEGIYSELMASPVAETVQEIVAPFAKPVAKTEELPPIDFGGLAKSIGDARRLIELYNEMWLQEEAAALLLLMH